MRFFFLLVIISVVNGCPTGTVLSPSNDVCYKAVNKSNIWLDAEYDCLRSGGNLAIPRNAFENSALVNLANKNFDKMGNFWIGGSTFIANNGGWAWVDGSNMSYTNWANGRPRNISEYDTISVHNSNGMWYDISRNATLPYICEVPVNSTSDLCQKNWQYLSATGKCYLVLTQNATWQQHRQTCLDQEADLASIHSPHENFNLAVMALNTLGFQMNRTIVYQDVIIGLTIDSFTGNMTWCDGTPLDYYQNLTNSFEDPNYAAITFSTNSLNFTWYGITAFDKYAAICESTF